MIWHAECRRVWLYSWIHAGTLARAWALVAKCSTGRSSNSRVECQASMTGLSSTDPGRPIDWQTESRWQAARNAAAVYAAPGSVFTCRRHQGPDHRLARAGRSSIPAGSSRRARRSVRAGSSPRWVRRETRRMSRIWDPVGWVKAAVPGEAPWFASPGRLPSPYPRCSAWLPDPGALIRPTPMTAGAGLSPIRRRDSPRPERVRPRLAGATVRRSAAAAGVPAGRTWRRCCRGGTPLPCG